MGYCIYMNTNTSETFTGYICKSCGAESPEGIGYAATAPAAESPATPHCPNPHA